LLLTKPDRSIIAGLGADVLLLQNTANIGKPRRPRTSKII